MTERLSEREKLIENIRKFMDSETTKYVVTDDYGEASESLATEIATWHLAEVKRIVAPIKKALKDDEKEHEHIYQRINTLRDGMEKTLKRTNGESEANNETPKMR